MGDHKTYGAQCHRCAHLRHGNEPVEVIGTLKGLECATCDFCAESALHRLLMASGGLDLFSPDTRAAVKAFRNGTPHPLLDQLRAECLLIEEENRGPEYVEFRGERWFVADAQFDEANSGGHWHLTLTAGHALVPQPAQASKPEQSGDPTRKERS